MDKDLQDRISLTAEVLKMTLESNNLFLAVDSSTEEFLFLDREAYRNGKAKYGKVKMKDINVV